MMPFKALRMRNAAPAGPTGVDAITGVYARYDASDLAGAVGSDVPTWNDRRGSNHATIHTTDAPQIGATINGLKTIAFSAGRAYKLPDDFLVGATGAFYIAVCQKNADPDGNIGTILTVKRYGASDSHTPYSNGVFYSGFAHNDRHNMGNPATSISSAPRLYAERSAPSDFKAFIDGIQFFTSAFNNFVIETFPGQKKIGCNGATSTWAGRVGELIVCNTAPSQADREKLEGYLAHKWGIAGNLDAAHPYKSTPPSL